MVETLVSLAVAVFVEVLIVWGVAAWWLRRKRRIEWDNRRAEIRAGIILMDARRCNASKKRGE